MIIEILFAGFVVDFGGFEEGDEDFGGDHNKDYEKADTRNENCSDSCGDKTDIIDDAHDDIGGFVFWDAGIFTKNCKIQKVHAKRSKEKIANIN